MEKCAASEDFSSAIIINRDTSRAHMVHVYPHGGEAIPAIFLLPRAAAQRYYIKRYGARIKHQNPVDFGCALFFSPALEV